MLNIAAKDTCYRKNPAVVCTELDEGAILLDLNTKYYYNLNQTALTIWKSMNESSIISEMAERLAEQYEVDQGQAEESAKRIMAELHKEGLVITL
ncbi:MAG: PqqD family protein [Acidobacteriota bacterium]|jgi:2-oxo-4-hydroxy-4-carboxy--5-ureidoimidazoline (OHCU) decarboxylase